MNSKSLGIAGLMAISALALIAVIAANPFTSQASTHEPVEMPLPTDRQSASTSDVTEITQPQQSDMLQGTQEDSDDSDPYIGIHITELDDGSVKVLRVMAGGPSEGLLMVGDIITAVDGTTIDGASDLVDSITEAGADTEISLTVTRDGSDISVNVIVGDRELAEASLRTFRTGRFHAIPGLGFSRSGRHKWASSSATGGEAVRSEVVVENDDGSFSTRRAVIGAVSNVDSAAGTFTLTPKDGADAIDYTISEDTKVILNRNGDLGRLNTEDDTYVIDVDGEVTMVVQGDWSDTRSQFYRGGKRFGLRDGARWADRRHLSDRASFLDSVFDELRQRLDNRS